MSIFCHYTVILSKNGNKRGNLMMCSVGSWDFGLTDSGRNIFGNRVTRFGIMIVNNAAKFLRNFSEEMLHIVCLKSIVISEACETKKTKEKYLKVRDKRGVETSQLCVRSWRHVRSWSRWSRKNLQNKVLVQMVSDCAS